MEAVLSIVIFVVSTVVGYMVIKNFLPFAHALMSGMNALSGITVLGALAAAVTAVLLSRPYPGILQLYLQ